jgi:ankyrin repeat protein
MLRHAVLALPLMVSLATLAGCASQEGIGSGNNGAPAAKTSATKGLSEPEQRARQGDAAAQYTLGKMYADGNGVPYDYRKAVEWYRKAADQGYAEAQYSLGKMYEHGLDVPRDGRKAVEWYRKAAAQGNEYAQGDVKDADVILFFDLCARGSAGQIADAIKNGADVNAKLYEQSSLNRAVQENPDPAVITTLVKAGADVNERAVSGRTPLMWVIDSNKSNPEVLDALIKAGAKVNEGDDSGRTPLMEAATQSDSEVLRSLIHAGAKVNASDKDGRTPLMEAASVSNQEAIMILLDAGADPKAINDHGDMAIDCIGDYFGGDGKGLRSNGKGLTDSEAFKRLSAASGLADGTPVINHSDFLKLCAEGSVQEVVNAIQHDGANVNAWYEERGFMGVISMRYTPLMAAALKNPSPEVITALIKAGADVNAKEKEEGETALIWATLLPNPKAIMALLDAHADPKAKDKNGKMAIDYAREKEELKGTAALKKLEAVSR